MAREYHRLTIHNSQHRMPSDDRLVAAFEPMNWLRKPPQFKSYIGLEVTPLPTDLTKGGGAGRLDLAGLARILFLSAGVVRTLMVGGRPMWFRSVGSAGNLHPIEVYVVTGDVPGLAAGVYHYAPVEHGLVRLASVPVDTQPALVLTGVPWRTAWKYRERGFRHLWWDAGTMLAHILTLAEDAGFSPRVDLGFVDAEVAALVGAAGPPDEVALAVVPLPPAGEAARALPAPGTDVAPTGHLFDDSTEFPLITEAHRGGMLNGAEEVSAWHEAAAALDSPPALSNVVFKRLDDLARVIRRRGSTRAFDPAGTAPEESLTAGLQWAAAPVPGDFSPDGSTLLEHFVAVFSVEGVEPGAYRHTTDGLEQIRAGDFRAACSRLCLDQALGGSGSFTVFHCADLRKVTGALGARGYRAAQLEAGVVEGRLHLAAFASGLGATGLTFYDEEVSRFFGTALAPMLVTAVGVPAYHARPGGLPGRPVEMVAG